MTKKKCVFAALLMLMAAASALWAQRGAAWPAWEGRNNADKRVWEEMGRWYEEALATDDEALKRMAAELPGKFTRQRDGVSFWKKNRDQYQAALTSAKYAMEQRRRERAEAERLAAERKAERERLAAERERLAAEAAEQERLAGEAARKAEEERLAAIAAANARGVTAADFTYDITRDGRGILIKGYTGKATIVTIPAVIEGLPVRELGNNVFARNRSITAVTIPDSVTTLADGKSVKNYYSRFNERIPGVFEGGVMVMPVQYSLGYVGVIPGVFEGCTSLSAVTLPQNLNALPSRIFYGCTSLAAVTVPAGVTAVGAEAFSNCTALAKVTLPAGLTVIKEFAFARCSGLQTIALPVSLTKIGPGAFMRSGLTGITLPRSLKDVDATLQDVEEGIYKEYGDNIFRQISVGVFEGCVQLETVTIEGGGIKLEGSFEGCRSLKTVTINGNITLYSVRRNDGNNRFNHVSPFKGCDNLTTVNIGPRVTKIDNVDMLINAGKLSIQTRAALARLRSPD